MDHDTNVRIYKYPLPIADVVDINMPIGATILSLQVQNGCPCIWARVDTTQPEETTRFFVVGTGHPIPVEATNYIGTVLTENDSLVWHVFKKPRDLNTLPDPSTRIMEMALTDGPGARGLYMFNTGCTEKEAHQRIFAAREKQKELIANGYTSALPPLSEEEMEMVALSTKTAITRAYRTRVGCTIGQAMDKVGEYLNGLQPKLPTKL